MSPTGIAIRVLVVVAWLAAVGVQLAVAQVAARGDLSGPARRYRDQRMVYGLTIEEASGLNRSIGSCRWHSDGPGPAQHSDCTLLITDPGVIPGIAPVLPLMRQLSGEPQPSESGAAAPGTGAHPHHHATPVTVHLLQTCAPDDTVVGLSGEASYGSLEASLDARFQADGLQVSWQAPGFTGSRTLPAVQGVRSCAIVGLLPAGIRVGRRFSIPMLGGDATALAPRLTQVNFRCTAEEEVVTNLGSLLLSRVEEYGPDQRLAATIWCDDSGLVYRQRWEELKVTLELSRLEAVGATARTGRGPAPAASARAHP